MKQTPGISQAPMQTQENDDDEIDLMALAGALVSGWKWILAAFVVAVSIGGFAALRSAPTYQAMGLLQLEQSQDALALPEGMKVG